MYILRVYSLDSHPQTNHKCEAYSNLRLVVHIAQGAQVLLLSNIRTLAGLVNGSLGQVIGVQLNNVQPPTSVPAPQSVSVSVTQVAYVIVDFPSYTGPVVFSGHPTWVPIRPIESRHKSIKSLCRTQLPLCLAYGLTIHKSQGLTFPQGCVVDFYAENQAPASQPGLAYVGMSRCTTFDRQGFRSLPDFWAFRAVLKQPIFLKRKAFEELMDDLHDDTMKRIDPHFSLESDIANHLIWTKRKTGSEPSSEEAADIRQMLSQRGVAEPPWYSDEEEAVVKKRLAPGRGSVTRMGMRPSTAAAPTSAPASSTRRVRAKASAKKSAASQETTAESNSISPALESLSQQKCAAVPKRRLRRKTSLPDPDPKRAKKVSDSAVDQLMVSRDALMHLPGHLRAEAKRDSGSVIVRHLFVVVTFVDLYLMLSTITRVTCGVVNGFFCTHVTRKVTLVKTNLLRGLSKDSRSKK